MELEVIVCDSNNSKPKIVRVFQDNIKHIEDIDQSDTLAHQQDTINLDELKNILGIRVEVDDWELLESSGDTTKTGDEVTSHNS